MASSDDQRPKKKQGIRIDSSLISAASGGEVQNELEGLGVSVFDQGTFEEGVMKQLDEEVSRRTAEQRKKFLIKDYARVQQEKSTLRHELEALSKKIASLLSRPLCDVVIALREMKSSQEQKKKQLSQLEVKERELARLISGKGLLNNAEECSSTGSQMTDAVFSVPPSSSISSEHQKLIQTGHMTPFGSSDSTSLATERQDSIIQQTETESSLSQVSVSEDTMRKSPSEGASVYRLCSDGFDGLFQNLSTSLYKPAKKKSRMQSSTSAAGGKNKGKEKKRVSLVVDGEKEEEEKEEGDDWLPTREEVEEMEKELVDDNDWDVKEGEEEEEDGTSEYTTDEELGADHVLGRKKAKKKRRPLSSGESEEEDLGGRSGRRKRRRHLSQTSHHLDDGDSEIYQQRMRECEETDGPAISDKVIDGRLRIPWSIWSRLYGYQRTGVHWLWELHCQQAGGVVGDEMGLGKTIQMIAFLVGLKVSRLRSHVTREMGLGPVLVVCPATVMHQWVSEFHTWWSPFRVAILHDTGTFSGGTKSSLIAEITECNGVLVTTYAGVRIYRDHLLPQRWDYVVLDEGHKIRNPDTEVTLVCKQFATPHRIILSGSPMQNNLRELWSLFDFVFPGKLGTLPVFMEQFSVPITLGGYANATQVQVQTAYRCACVLRDTINPYLLRRLKADVKIQLPSKNEQVLFCKLTAYQQELYEDYVTGPDVAAMMVGRKKIFTGLTILRKLCNHPDLVTNDYRDGFISNGDKKREEGEEEEEEDRVFIRSRIAPDRRKRRLSARTFSETERGKEEEEEERWGYCEERFGWAKRSGKMVVVEALLKMWSQQKHRVLLFSQSKLAHHLSYLQRLSSLQRFSSLLLSDRLNREEMLNILELMVQAKNYSYLRMDGDTPIKARQPLIRQFNETSSIFVFLLTTRVGGLGVNLTGADRIIIYDPDWNPSTDTQARERAWRIGQKRQVTIYRLLTSGTIEEKIYHRQIFKQFLSNRVLKDPRQRRFFKANDLYELFSLGQVHPKGGTETSAIFAGTGSDVVPKKTKKRRQKSRDRTEKSHDSGVRSGDLIEELNNGGTVGGVEGSGSELRIANDGGGGGGGRGRGEKEEGECSEEDGISPKNKDSCNSETGILQTNSQLLPPDRPALSCSGMTKVSLDSSNTENNNNNDTSSSFTATQCSDNQLPSIRGDRERGLNVGEMIHHQKQKKNKSKKKKKKKRKKDRLVTEVEGVKISGVEKKGLYRAAGEGEGEKNSNCHDDYILTKLFKKSGVHSAIQHDSIMSSASSDHVVIETEAKKVAQSAARALRESRRRCLAQGGRAVGGEGGGGRGWGQLTWTGQHGSAGSSGRQQPRFGKTAQQRTAKGASLGQETKLFDGQKAGTSVIPSPQKPKHSSSSISTTSSSTSTSSSSAAPSSASLLSAMRSRNSHTLPQHAVKDIHKSAHDNLMREIRDFIATRCKFDGQATTDELLSHFSSKLPNSDTATFRSMLHEICDFSRIHGEGRWILKSQFR